jgi:class 3 adenylate cyclase
MANIEFERSLQKKVKEYMLLKYEVQRIERVPTKLDATFGEKASSIQAACLFIDIRNSTGLLLKNRSSEVANLLKSFHFICVKTIRENCGEVRSFNGDSSLGIFAESSCCNNAVMSAFAIKYYLNLLLKKQYNVAANLDYGIGIDFGSIFVAKVGYSGEFNNDLIWIGLPVNRAVKISNQVKNPKNIAISDFVYKRLWDNNKTFVDNSLGEMLAMPSFGIKKEIWSRQIVPMFYSSDPAPYYTSYERPL